MPLSESRRILVFENYGSFVCNLVQYIGELRAEQTPANGMVRYGDLLPAQVRFEHV